MSVGRLAARRFQDGAGVLLDAGVALGLGDDLKVGHRQVALLGRRVAHPVGQTGLSVRQNALAERQLPLAAHTCPPADRSNGQLAETR